MYNLDEKTEVNKFVDKSELLDNFDFHRLRRKKIERVIDNFIITNQIDSYEYFDESDKNKNERIQRYIYFISITMLNYIENEEFDYYDFLTRNKSLINDIYDQINRDVFLTITNSEGVPRLVIYNKKNYFNYIHIPDDLEININLDDTDDFYEIYKEIIFQIEDAEIKNKSIDSDSIEYEEVEYDSIQNGISLESSNWAYWDYLVNNGVYPEDNINLLKCDEYLFNF